MDRLGMTYSSTIGPELAQQAFQNKQTAAVNESNLKSAALSQESAGLELQAKKIELANQEAFKASILAQMAGGEQKQAELAKLSGAPTPHDEMKQKLDSTNEKITAHVSLVQATQKAIDETATSDPLYAAKMQTQLDAQIKEGFKLSKEQNEIKAKEAEKVSDGMAPVFSPEGKLDPDMYRAWYSQHKTDGVPLASFGLTGDPITDDKAARLLYAQGVKAKDQVDQQAKMLAAKEKIYMDQSLVEVRKSTIQHQRALEASAQTGLQAKEDKSAEVAASKDRTNRTKEMKAQNEMYQQYQTTLLGLKKSKDKMKDQESKDIIQERINNVTANFKTRQKTVRESYGLSGGLGGSTKSVASPTSEAASAGF